MDKTIINSVAKKYIEYLKALPEKDRYTYFHGSFSVKGATLNKYLFSLNLEYSDFKTLSTELDELDRYVEMYVEKPKKKIVKKKIVDSDEE
jgi:hypothetical protein